MLPNGVKATTTLHRDNPSHRLGYTRPEIVNRTPDNLIEDVFVSGTRARGTRTTKPKARKMKISSTVTARKTSVKKSVTRTKAKAATKAKKTTSRKKKSAKEPELLSGKGFNIRHF